jgi:hypothetical protein
MGSVPLGPSAVLCAVAGVFAVLGASAPRLDAQVTALSAQNQHRKGQSVSPVYEGWYRGSDGLIRVVFGYQNRNTEERLEIPVGPNNKIEPGAADQGQPTHFLTGRQYGVFAITLPKERSTTEVVWTITSNGATFSIPANLDTLYLVESLGTLYTKNEPPKLRFASGDAPAMGPAGPTISLSTTIAKPLSIDVWVSDETIPPRRRPTPNPARGNRPAEPARGAPPAEQAGLAVTWTKFRGPGKVDFDKASPPIEGGKATTVVSFDQPGDYALRVLASDGSSLSGQCCWTNGYVKVRVEAGQ